MCDRADNTNSVKIFNVCDDPSVKEGNAAEGTVCIVGKKVYFV